MTCYLLCCLFKITFLKRVYSTLAPSQWDTSSRSKVVSHWLGANLESAVLKTLKISAAPAMRGEFQCHDVTIHIGLGIRRHHNCWSHLYDRTHIANAVVIKHCSILTISPRVIALVVEQQFSASEAILSIILRICLALICSDNVTPFWWSVGSIPQTTKKCNIIATNKRKRNHSEEVSAVWKILSNINIS